MVQEALGVVYGLASAASWGAGDFSGGLASRSSKAGTVLVVSQCAGLSLLLGLALLFGEPFPPGNMLLLGVMVGALGIVGLLCLYSGLAGGRMGLVAPITAVINSILPVTVGIIIEGRPGNLQLLGFLVALGAVWMLSRSGGEASIKPRELGLAVAAGLCLGTTLVLIDRFSYAYVFWPLVASRISSITLLWLFLALVRRPVRLEFRRVPLVLAAGILDALGNLFFALASGIGRLDISALLSSLYPAVTVMLAWLVLKERLAPGQRIGVLVALVALVLITA